MRGSLLLCLLWGPGCGGATDADDEGVGGGTATGGTASGGSSGALGGSSSGGASSGGTGNAAAGGTGASQCDFVGCGAPPLCAVGCTSECGCCFCTEGEAVDLEGVKHECVGGCWAPVGAACSWNGASYGAGEVFPAGDGCNDCTCDAGGSVSCTEMLCPECDPALEMNRREYIATSLDECAAIDYLCAENTFAFSNACGCGCEQSASCPEWIDCMPGGADAECADLAAFAARCPFSGVAM